MILSMCQYCRKDILFRGGANCNIIMMLEPLVNPSHTLIHETSAAININTHPSTFFLEILSGTGVLV